MKNDNLQNIPQLLTFPTAGNPETGLLVSTQAADRLPFPVKRVFWVRQVPPGFRRGNHAGQTMEEVLVAVQGRVVVKTESQAGGQQAFVLDKPDLGLYVPARCWIELTFSADALLLCLASTDFEESDYIADYATFRKEIFPGE